jgi:hypothetical protein
MSANDPIERLSVEVEVFAVAQTPGMPPMTESFFHVRRRQDGAGGTGVLGLPAYKGDPGDQGPAGMIHKGDRTTAELDGLALVLGPESLNFTYRNTDDRSQWVWSGNGFVVYADAFGAPGDTGPAPVMEGGTVTIAGVVQEAPAAVDVSGAAGGPYRIDLDLPAMPKGDPGEPGPAGPIYTSVDVEGDPEDGDVLVHDDAAGKMVWRSLVGSAVTEEYVVPAVQFPNADMRSGDVRQTLVAVTIPPRPFRYRIGIGGAVDTLSPAGHRIDVEVRTGDATSGPIVGYGKGFGIGVWFETQLRSQSQVAIGPTSDEGVYPADKEVTVYATAVKKLGSTLGWSVKNDWANLRIQLHGVD